MKESMQELSMTFDEVYERWSPDVWRICVLYFGGRVADVEDATQETFLRYWKGNLHLSEEHTKAWLLVTAGNVCKDMLKNKNNRNIGLDSLPEVGVRINEKTKEVFAPLLKLPKKLKTAIYLYYYEEYTAKEIAESMGISEKSVSNYLSRGRKRLKGILEKEEKHHE